MISLGESTRNNVVDTTFGFTSPIGSTSLSLFTGSNPYGMFPIDIKRFSLRFSASNCSALSCEENQECVQMNNIFTCVCKADYEEPDCRLGKLLLKTH